MDVVINALDFLWTELKPHLVPIAMLIGVIYTGIKTGNISQTTIQAQARTDHVFFMRKKLERLYIEFSSHNALWSELNSDMDDHLERLFFEQNYRVSDDDVDLLDQRHLAFRNDHMTHVHLIVQFYGSNSLKAHMDRYDEYLEVISLDYGKMIRSIRADMLDGHEPRLNNLILNSSIRMFHDMYDAIRKDAQFWGDDEALLRTDLLSKEEEDIKASDLPHWGSEEFGVKQEEKGHRTE